MNKHIELCKKWLDDPDSVTTEELEANADAASAVVTALTNAASDAVWAAYVAATYAKSARRCAKIHEELLNENL